ncbi:MAG: ATP phosphoribosyltransferase regulatory subunit [Coriobacteriia bacterium]|nr:ATP phosphoribosyltransferase regulatory subunit [Coriobacteriia bacterium]
MRPVTPRGFRDVLFQEAAERRTVARAMGDVFERWGYRFVETPALEEYRTLAAAAGASLEGTAFRMVDLDGSLLALRPEMTLPIARLAASRLTGEPVPHRLCYVADVFREQASLRGEARQFTQVGVELLGVNGPQSDAEAVAVLVDALEATGLPEFTVGVGTVAVLRALLEAAGGDAAWQAAVLAAAHDRNLVTLDRLTGADGVDPRVGDALRRVVRIGGGREAIAACREVAGAVGCADALDALERTWELLEASGVARRVRVDFGILRSFDYYTGLIVESYAPGLGLPLGGGGRYDDVLAAFDAPMPAAGFALSLERVMIALTEQGVTVPTETLDVVVGGVDAIGVARACAGLRARGLRVLGASACDAAGIAAEAASAGASRAVIVEGATLTTLDAGGMPTGVFDPEEVAGRG